jgi:hypothetical protein
VPEQLQVPGGAVCRDGIQALIPGQVRGVDEAAQRVCGLPGPDRVRMGLGGVLKIVLTPRRAGAGVSLWPASAPTGSTGT